MSKITVPVHYYRPATDPGVPCREENIVQRELTWTLKVSETALVLVDVWDRGYLTSAFERAAEVTKKKIAPVVTACRKIGMTIIHAPCPEAALNYPQWVRYASSDDLAEGDELFRDVIDPPRPDAWPPAEFRRRKGQYVGFAKPAEAIVQKAESAVEKHKRRIASWIEPQADDFVVKGAGQLHRLLKHRRILHLFYAGFGTNACMLYRSYGVRNMAAMGYNIILLRDCTDGAEVRETLAEKMLTRAAIIEMERAFVSTNSDALLAECKKVIGRK